MADDSVSTIFCAITDLLSGLINFVLRKLGYPEVTVIKLSMILGWVLVAICVLLLIWFTVSYS